MTLNRRALLLILPVALLCSLTLVGLGYTVQREAVIGLERSRLSHDLAALETTYREYDHFSRNLLYALSNSAALGNFLRQTEVPYRNEALGTQLQLAVRQLAGDDAPSRISLAIARPDLSLAYYYERSGDPFAQLSGVQRQLLERLAKEPNGPLERRDYLLDEQGRSLLVATTSLLPSTAGPPLPGQRGLAMTLQLAVSPDRMEALRHGLEQSYGAPLEFSRTPPARTGDFSAIERLSPDLYVRLTPDPARLDKELRRLAIAYFSGGLLVTLACILVLIVLIRRYITRPIARLDSQLTEVLEGQRQALETGDEPGEIGHLGANMKRLHDNNLAILAQLRTALRTDVLTQIGNRRYFQLMGESWLAGKPDGRRIALLYFGLDHFKSVNDRFSHEVGDELLQAVARQTQQQLAAYQADNELVFTRLAGDEFAILLRGPAAATDALALGQQLQQNYDNGTLVGERRYAVTLSIGLAAPEAPLDLADLLAQADLALERAKNEGGNRLVHFTPELAARQRRQDLLDEHLRRMNPDEEFHLVYMPAVDSNDQVRSAETLLRWNSPRLGPVSPAEFIPIAERQGHFRWIDRWVVDQACREYPALQEVLGSELVLSVNLSSAQLDQADIVPYLRERVRHHGVDPGHLELEFTETFAAELNERTLGLLHELRAEGFRVAIDDFGVGYTSIQQVTDYPADTIKFDRLIVERLSQPGNQASLDALIAFCHARDAQVIAEGVDTELKQLCLHQAGCDLLQGFLVCPPRRLDELRDWQRQRLGDPSRR
ncbi:MULTISPECIES: putative bifunctional diguanylate cyclase/phosphodiesterase [unclassified Pseudomonas]|uniref:putative bifunctional diguanylate cyclase/phosphodiesterase n=1 Tax=unclassified Pseudomonas TaxID=196821 RepID=UPI002361E945|nr:MULTISPECIES: GGDEF domain-containing phosphodiesterase [unclassified Pseudomonas]MDR6180315.1 diguanylate cyclase (GGDEF)-like protein [Pseudomonas sp. SORGH_AS_0211]